MTKSITIIGATGHLGHRVAAKLAGKGVDVTAIVRDPATAMRDSEDRTVWLLAPLTLLIFSVILHVTLYYNQLDMDWFFAWHETQNGEPVPEEARRVMLPGLMALGTSVAAMIALPMIWLSRLAGLSRNVGDKLEWFPLGRILIHAAVAVAIGLAITGFLVGYNPDTIATAMVEPLSEWFNNNPDVERQLSSEEIESLKETIARLETNRDIDSSAYKDVESSLLELQEKIQEQAAEIAFYRGIISPADGVAGLRVQDLRLSRANTERTYNVRLVLVQSLKHDRTVSGDVNLIVQGVQNGSEVSYPYAQLLATEADSNWAFKFRYFQDFDREIILPDGFTPESIRIEVQSKTRSISSIEESFAWTASPG